MALDAKTIEWLASRLGEMAKVKVYNSVKKTLTEMSMNVPEGGSLELTDKIDLGSVTVRDLLIIIDGKPVPKEE